MGRNQMRIREIVLICVGFTIINMAMCVAGILSACDALAVTGAVLAIETAILGAILCLVLGFGGMD